MFMDDPLSSKAFGRVYPLQLMVMYNAFVLPHPLDEISSLEKVITRSDIAHELANFLNRYVTGDISLT